MRIVFIETEFDLENGIIDVLELMIIEVNMDDLPTKHRFHKSIVHDKSVEPLSRKRLTQNILLREICT